MLRHELTADVIDDVLAATFPASDPPSWTPGVVRLAPEPATGAAATANRPAAPARAGDTARIEASPPARSGRTHLQALRSLLGAIAVVLVFPLAILALVLPFALAVRGALEAGRWLATFIW